MALNIVNGTYIGRFSSKYPEVVVIPGLGDVVEYGRWAGYLWEIIAFVSPTVVRLKLLVPPDHVPWKNAPPTIRVNLNGCTVSNAMEVLARTSARDDSLKGVNKRTKAYAKVLRDIQRQKRLITHSKRTKAKIRARNCLHELAGLYPEIPVFPKYLNPWDSDPWE